MNEILKTVLSLSLSGTLLMAVLFLLKALYKNKMSKAWQYYIWLIVAARLLFPFTPETTLIGSAFVSQESRIENKTAVLPQDNLQSDFINGEVGIIPPEQTPETAPPINPQSASVSDILLENLWFAWIAVALALAVRKVIIYQHFSRKVKAGSEEISDIDTLNMLSNCEEALRVKRPVELYKNPLISSPMLIGFFRPVIVVPSTEMSENSLRLIMKHELIHFKRFDMFYKWLIQITACLHWFNPFVWVLSQEINKCCELACDEAVIKSLDSEQKREYGDTLLYSIKYAGEYENSQSALALTESGLQIKERLFSIMSFKKKSKAVAAVTLALTLFICASAAVFGAYKAPDTAAPADDTLTQSQARTAPSTPKAPQTPASSAAEASYTNTVFDDDHDYNYDYNYDYDDYDFQYSSNRSAYHQGKHIFEIAWNLTEKGAKKYSNKAEVKLSSSAMTVSFDKAAAAYIKDKEVMSELTAVLEKIGAKAITNKWISVLERPLVIAVEFTGDKTAKELADKYYKEKNMKYFSAVTDELTQTQTRELTKKAYDDRRIDFFSVVYDDADKAFIKEYTKKAYDDRRIDFFSVLLDETDKAFIKEYTKKAYDDRRIDFFSVLLDETDKAFIKEYTKKAYDDRRIDFFSVLLDDSDKALVKEYTKKALEDGRIDFAAMLG